MSKLYEGVSMSTFPAMKNADAIKSMCDTDLHLYEEMTNSMLATIFKLADLNLSALKQMTTSYQDALTKLGKDELKAMPRALNMAMSKADTENMVAYQQQIAKVMLDLQAAFVKTSQRHLQQALNSNAMDNLTTAQIPDGGAAGLSFIQNMVEQAGKGYAEWANNALHAMDGVGLMRSSEETEKDATKTTRSAARK
jgi:hypothetical protein